MKTLDVYLQQISIFQQSRAKRLNELIKENGLYVKGAHKRQKVKAICSLPNVQDIIFREIYIQNYGSIIEFTSAIKGITTTKRKQGRPKGSKNKKSRMISPA